MVGHGARVEGPIGAAGIGRQGGQLHLGGHVAAEGAQQGPQSLGIPPPPIQPLHVHLAHLLQVIAGGPGCRRQGPLQLGRPAAAADELGKIRHAQPRIGAAGRLPLQQRCQGDAALAGATFHQAHRPQPQKRKPPRSGVALGVIGRHRRTGEQKLPGRIDGIHRPPHLVP